MSLLTKTELLSIIRHHRDNSLGVDDGELSGERAKALDHYHGRPYGNEVEGRSSVVTKDLSEAIDWAVPAIMRVFIQSGNIAEFDPVGPEDEEQAEQESDYLNHVIMQDNEGFIVLHDAIKDALLLKNGYVKYWWDKSEKITDEDYEGLTLEQVQVLLQQLESGGAKVDIKGQDERMVDMGGQMVPVFDLKLRITRSKGKVCLVGVPAEEIRVSNRCRGSLQESPFTEHVTRKTRSELIEMGMNRDFVDTLPAWDGAKNDDEVYSRDQFDDESDELSGISANRAMEEIEYCEAYIKVDWDDDGIAELRKVVSVGGKIPDGEDWNETIDFVPITSFVAKRVPYRHVGESLDDDLCDLQEIQTTLMRQLLDNIYRTNNQETVVNERVNLNDFLTSVPGGIKRVEGMGPVGDAYAPIIHAPIIDKILPVVDHINAIKENRTGINRSTTGLDPDILKQSTKGAFLENLNRASQKIEMMTRMLAETGVKEMVLNVHALLIKYQDQQRVTRMRGKYLPINPQEWQERTDLTVRVGIGTGNEEEKREKLMLLASLQEKVAQMGIVGPEQAYAMFADICETLGFDTPEKYVLDPTSQQFQQAQQQKQGQSNPLAEAEQVKGQFAMQAKQMQFQYDSQIKQMQEQHKHEMDLIKMRYDMENARAERVSRETIETAKLEFQAWLAGVQVDIGRPGIGAGMQEGGV